MDSAFKSSDYVVLIAFMKICQTFREGSYTSSQQLFVVAKSYFSLVSNMTSVPISSSNTTIKCTLLLNVRLMADTKLGGAAVSTIKSYVQCASLVGQVSKVGKLHWFGTRMK